MNVNETMMPYSIEGFLSDAEVEHVVRSIDLYKMSVDPKKLQAGATGYTIHDSGSLNVSEIVAVYEPAGRLEVNWREIPRDIVDIIEAAFYRRIEDIRRAFPSAFGPHGFTYVEYQPGQFFTAHVDGASREQVAGFGVTLTNDFDGGEFSVEPCRSGRLWATRPDGQLTNAPGHNSRSAWYRSLPRTRWTTRPVRGNAVFYGSGLTHSSQPVTKGVLRKVLAFIRSY
jgi:2OG-Fe(II) oxygenase superfamily